MRGCWSPSRSLSRILRELLLFFPLPTKSWRALREQLADLAQCRWLLSLPRAPDRFFRHASIPWRIFHASARTLPTYPPSRRIPGWNPQPAPLEGFAEMADTDSPNPPSNRFASFPLH